MSKVQSIHNAKTPKRIHYINEWLEHRGLTQAEVVDALGLNKGTISKWCSGDLPGANNIYALAEFLNIEPNDLFRDPGDDWIARFFRNRSEEERTRMVETLKIAFPPKSA